MFLDGPNFKASDAVQGVSALCKRDQMLWSLAIVDSREPRTVANMPRLDDRIEAQAEPGSEIA